MLVGEEVNWLVGGWVMWLFIGFLFFVLVLSDIVLWDCKRGFGFFVFEINKYK